MSEQAPKPQTRILLYSDDRSVRADVRLALGSRVASDLPEVEVFEAATQPAVFRALSAGGFDLAILDAEAVPSGGMGICKQIKDELPDAPPVLLIVARVADAWLATWSRAEGITTHPIDPVRLPGQVAGLLRTRMAKVG